MDSDQEVVNKRYQVSLEGPDPPNAQAWQVNPKPETRNRGPKPKTHKRTPKPEIRNPKPGWEGAADHACHDRLDRRRAHGFGREAAGAVQFGPYLN